MITAALNGIAVSPRPLSPRPDLDAQDSPTEAETTHALSTLAAEIAERIEEMNGIRTRAGTDLVIRLATVGRNNPDAFALLIAVFHGRTAALLDSYAAQAASTGREKQTMHYRTHQAIAYLIEMWPETASVLERIRTSVRHHEDPLSTAQTIRDSAGATDA